MTRTTNQYNALTKSASGENTGSVSKSLRTKYFAKKELFSTFASKFQEGVTYSKEYLDAIDQCCKDWIEHLQIANIKHITVGGNYQSKGIDMITSQSPQIHEMRSEISGKNTDLSYNQMCQAFTKAAKQLGILTINQLPVFVSKEIVSSFIPGTENGISCVDVTFNSGVVTGGLSYLRPDAIQIGDVFMVEYTDKSKRVPLTYMQVDAAGKRKTSWVTQEYIDSKKDERYNAVDITMKKPVNKTYKLGNNPEEYELSKDLLGYHPEGCIDWQAWNDQKVYRERFLGEATDADKQITLVSPDGTKKIGVQVHKIVTREAFPLSFFGEPESDIRHQFMVVSYVGSPDQVFIIPMH